MHSCLAGIKVITILMFQYRLSFVVIMLISTELQYNTMHGFLLINKH